MTICNWLLFALWIVFVAYWVLSAIGAKRTVGGRAWWREGAVRLGVLAFAALALQVPALRHVLQSAHAAAAPTGMVVGVLGVVLCALGIGLAVWARIHIGRNWGMPMSRKEDPELVTTGPYAFIRHPIYTGMLVAILGSAIGGSRVWLLPLSLFGPYFIYSARREERLMLEQFPAQYSAYMARTKMLLPFLL
jgi:protein-S-isoprenylcysteine O-methyltransferase Ste14